MQATATGRCVLILRSMHALHRQDATHLAFDLCHAVPAEVHVLVHSLTVLEAQGWGVTRPHSSSRC